MSDTFTIELLRLAAVYRGLHRAANAIKPQHGTGTAYAIDSWTTYYAAADKAGAAGQALLDWAKGAE